MIIRKHSTGTPFGIARAVALAVALAVAGGSAGAFAADSPPRPGLKPAVSGEAASGTKPADAGPAGKPDAKPAPKADPNAELEACSRVAESNPDQGLVQADAWAAKNGGDPARLCRALALFHKGDFRAAAALFVDLANSLGKSNPRASAELLGRAGWAALRSGDNASADHFYTEALDRAPDDVDLHIDRAFARAEAKRIDAAIADLDAAVAAAPNRAEAYFYRAAAHKANNQIPQALADVDKALALKPGDPEALLLRGNLRAQSGNTDGAGEDWRAVVGLSPQSAQGKAARANLDKLDAAGRAAKTQP